MTSTDGFKKQVSEELDKPRSPVTRSQHSDPVMQGEQKVLDDAAALEKLSKVPDTPWDEVRKIQLQELKKLEELRAKAGIKRVISTGPIHSSGAEE